MKTTFAEFLECTPSCRSWQENSTARQAFELLNEDTLLLAMLELSDLGKPALCACLTSLHALCQAANDPAFSLEEWHTRQGIGRMVGAVLRPFGYRPIKQKDLPKALAGYGFAAGAVYAKNGPATLRVVKAIEEVPVNERPIWEQIAQMTGANT